MRSLTVALVLVGVIASHGVAHAQFMGGSLVLDAGTENETTCGYEGLYSPETHVYSMTIWCDDGWQRNWSGVVANPPGMYGGGGTD